MDVVTMKYCPTAIFVPDPLAKVFQPEKVLAFFTKLPEFDNAKVPSSE